MKIVLACRHLNNMSGGVERIITWLANSLVEDDFDVTLLCWDTDAGKPFYKVNPKVKLSYMNIGDPYQRADIGTRLKRLWRLRQFFKEIRPDLIVGFQIGTLFPIWLGSLFLKSKLILTERNSLQFIALTSAKRKRWIPYYYALADKTIVQFEEYRKDYPPIVDLGVVHNPVFVRMNTGVEKKNIILSVGRHSYQKNYDILIEAFKDVHKIHPDWKLVILGNGEETKKLEEKIVDLRLNDYVVLAPPTLEVDSFYQEAKIFCLPSRWEGFPNALAEALASGLPSVGFRSCDGVNILIQDGINGYLANTRDSKELARCLAELASDNDRLTNMSANARTIVNNYSPQKVYKEWVDLFKEMTK